MVVEVPGLSQRYQPGSEVEQLELRGLLGAVQPIPIQPCGLIVLRVGVVVAVLRVAEFVAGKQHRRAQGEQQRAQHVHDGPFSLLCDDRITARAFMSEIDGMVVVAAVPVVLSVGFVVLMPILGQIGGGEAVVACHVVHGCGRSASGVVANRSAEPHRRVAMDCMVMSPIHHHVHVPHRSARRCVCNRGSVVPFREGDAELSRSPAVRAAIPRFHDHLEVAEQQIGAQRVQERVVSREFAVKTRQRRRKIESESVDTNAFGPIAQRIHGERGDVRVGEIKRVAATGGVVQATDLVFGPSVIGEVVESTPADGRAFRTGFAGVVVHHVHDDLETGLMHGPHHVDDLLPHGARSRFLRLLGGVRGFGGEVASVE